MTSQKVKYRVCLVVLNEFTNDSRVLKEAVSLQKAGYDVLVLALHGGDLPEKDRISGVPVRRVKLWTRSWSKRKVVQFVKYAEFLMKAVFAGRKFDVLHCNDLNALPIGVLSKLLKFGRQKIVYDAHEFEIDCKPGGSRKAVRVNAGLERRLIRHADAVITVSPSIAKAYRRLYGIETPTLVLNCPPRWRPAKRYDKFREELGIRANQKIFLYQGGLYPGRGIEALLDAFTRQADESAVIVFMGYGPLEQLAMDSAKHSNNVFFRKAVSSSELLEYTASADVGFVFTEKSCASNRWCLPNKFFEYIMADLKVVCSNLIEPKKIVESFGFGICLEGDASQDLEHGISHILRSEHSCDPGATKRAGDIYCWENQEATLLNVYLRVLIDKFTPAGQRAAI